MSDNQTVATQRQRIKAGLVATTKDDKVMVNKDFVKETTLADRKILEIKKSKEIKNLSATLGSVYTEFSKGGTVQFFSSDEKNIEQKEKEKLFDYVRKSRANTPVMAQKQRA